LLIKLYFHCRLVIIVCHVDIVILYVLLDDVMYEQVFTNTISALLWSVKALNTDLTRLNALYGLFYHK